MHGARKPPHPATVTQTRTPHVARVVQRRMPHPATVGKRAAPVAQRMDRQETVSPVSTSAQTASFVHSTIRDLIQQKINGLKAKRDLEQKYLAKSQIEKDITKAAEFLNLHGHVVTVSNADKAYYYVPDGREKPLNLSLLATNLASYLASDASKNIAAEWRDLLTKTLSFAESSGSKPYTRTKDITLDLPKVLSDARAELVPLYTLHQWYELFANKAYSTKETKKTKRFKLMVNANWFNIQGLTGYPNLAPLTFMMGLSVRKGQPISLHTKFTELGSKLDALAVFDEGQSRRVSIVGNAAIASLPSTPTFAVGGFIILDTGKERPRDDPSATPNASKQRTGVGISVDGKQLHVVVVETGIPLKTLSGLFVELGDHHAIDLDNSGSSQMVFEGTERTQPSDVVEGLGATKRFRPVPNFFAVSDTKTTK